MLVIDGQVLTCSKCLAPYQKVLPEGWSYTVRRFRKRPPLIYTHTPDCPRRFPAVVIPDVD